MAQNQRAQRARQTGNKIFQEVTSNLYYTGIFTVYMFTALYFSMGTEVRAGPAPFTVYLLATIIALLLAVNESRKQGGDFNSFVRVLGFDQPYSGYNYLLALTGVGIAIWLHQIATNVLAVAPGNAGVAAAAFPLYNAYTAFPNASALELSLVQGISVVLYHMLVVAPNEEIWVYTMSKNIANWLSTRRIIGGFGAIFISILAARGIWTTWHWFSWEGLTLLSILTGIVYGLFFFIPNFIADITGLLTPENPVNLRRRMIVPAITAHGTWNSLVTIGGLGLGFAGNLLLGGILVAGSLLGMYIIRAYKGP